jgi:hypothetical protein
LVWFNEKETIKKENDFPKANAYSRKGTQIVVKTTGLLYQATH